MRDLMLSNTIVFNDGTSRTLAKINQDAYSSEYMFRDSTLQYVLKIRHSKTKATATVPSYDRHNVEVVKTVFAAGGSPEVKTKYYFVMEQEGNNTNVALADAICDLCIASTNSFLVDILGWQN